MARAAQEINVSVTFATERAGVPASTSFRRWVAAALHGRIRRADLALRIVGEVEGRSLNRHYRGKDYATNVLSFPAELPPGLPAGTMPILGDIVICAPVVQSEARLQGKDPRAHFAHLTVHGILHLLGFEHEDPKEAEAMEALERTILDGLGFPDPYAEELA